MDGWAIPASDLIPGDFNGDKVVDHADLAVWTIYYGTNADGQDFLDWQRNFGVTLSTYSAFSAVPEPYGLALLLVSILIFLPVLRQRGSQRSRRALLPTGLM